MTRATRRIQIVGRIDPTLRKQMAAAIKREKTTLNALIEVALTRYLAGPEKKS
jgi:predicted HicB family RNase H-like nuclease